MKTCFTMHFNFVKAASLTVIAIAALPGLTSNVSAAGFSVEEIRAPGPASSMSSAGYLTGTYEAKCSWTGPKFRRRKVCYYAPWYYDGKRVTKVSLPTDWNFFSLCWNTL